MHLWQIVAVLMLIAGAACYMGGLRTQKPWGKPSVSLFMIGAIVAGLLRLVALPLFGVAAVAAYLWGVKRHKLWGLPVVALCAVLAIVLSFVGGSSDSSPGAGQVIYSHPMYFIGQALKGKLEDDAQVFVFRPPLTSETTTQEGPLSPMQEDMDRLDQQVLKHNLKLWEKALREGAGVRVRIVGHAFPMRKEGAGGAILMDAKAFSEVLDAHPDLDAWVSLIGMPIDLDGRWELEKVSTSQRPKRPLVAVDLMGTPDSPELAALLRQWIERDILQAVVVATWNTSGVQMRALTKENMGELSAAELPPSSTEQEALPAAPTEPAGE